MHCSYLSRTWTPTSRRGERERSSRTALSPWRGRPAKRSQRCAQGCGHRTGFRKHGHALVVRLRAALAGAFEPGNGLGMLVAGKQVRYSALALLHPLKSFRWFLTLFRAEEQLQYHACSRVGLTPPPRKASASRESWLHSLTDILRNQRESVVTATGRKQGVRCLCHSQRDLAFLPASVLRYCIVSRSIAGDHIRIGFADSTGVGGVQDIPICWICLDVARPDRRLVQPCACPRFAHAQCLARWQLQSAGSRYAPSPRAEL